MDYSAPKGTRNSEPIIKVELWENLDMANLWHKDFGRGGGIKTVMAVEIIALDKTFWEALGRVLGWPNDYWNFDIETSTTGERRQGHYRYAEGIGIYFNELILTGGNVEKFWEELLK